MKAKIVLLVMPMFLASAAFGAEPKQAAVSSPACGPSKVKYDTQKSQQHPELSAADGTARVYVISQLDYAGLPVGCQVVTRIGMDGKWLGANCGTSYLSAVIPAGEHHLCADWQSTVFMSSRPGPALDGFTAEAGKIYYFRAKALYTDGLTTIDLNAINPDEGKLLLASSPASVSKPKK